MPSTYTNSLRFIKQGTGENSGTWGALLNASDFDLLDSAIAGVTSLNVTTGSDIPLTTANGSADEARAAVIQLNGAPISAIGILIPPVTKTYLVDGTNFTGVQTITINVSGQAGVSITAGQKVIVWCDGMVTHEVNRQPESSLAANSVNTTQIVNGAVTSAKLDPSILFIPPGAVIDFAGSSAPAGWLLCTGGTQSIASYPTLAAVLGTTYGGDGITTFGIPDYRGKVLAGKDNMGGVAANILTFIGSGIHGDTLGASGGDQLLQTHTHIQNPHTHSVPLEVQLGGGTNVNTFYRTDGDTPAPVTTGSTTAVNQNTGGGSGQNVQPTSITLKIIKT